MAVNTRVLIDLVGRGIPSVQDLVTMLDGHIDTTRLRALVGVGYPSSDVAEDA